MSEPLVPRWQDLCQNKRKLKRDRVQILFKKEDFDLPPSSTRNLQPWSCFKAKATKLRKQKQRNWAIVTNSNCLIPISLKPKGLNFWNLKLRLFSVTETICFEISKVYEIGLQRYNDLKIWDCGKEAQLVHLLSKKSQPFKCWKFMIYLK